MAKQIVVQCPRPAAQLIIEALNWFVASHYPYAADECSGAAREALLEVIGRFERELPEGRSQYSSRIRAFLGEAVKGYTSNLEARSGESFHHRRAMLIAVCRGESDAGDWSIAAARDAGGLPG